MEKQFYCKECDRLGTSAVAFVHGDVVHYQCETCNEIVVLAVGPCVHKWYVPSPVTLTNVETRRIWRKCIKCEATQEGMLTVSWNA